jgi:hypothetical protein
MIKSYNFFEMLEYSRGVREQTDLDTIAAMIDGCIDVTKTDVEMDRQGVDYIATLRGGATVLVDAKTRTAGCSRWWRNGPELALEKWSVRPENGQNGKTGWTLCETKQVDYILFTFDPSDSSEVFLYPFQLLRLTFRRNLSTWYGSKKYKVDVQNSGTWRSECVFMPEQIVFNALREVMVGRVAA